MEEDSTSAADIPGEGKQFTGVFKDPDDMLGVHVPDTVPVRIGDQTIGVARTKRVPDGIKFDMEVDWVETKRGWIDEHLVKPLLPAEFSFDYEPPEPPRFLRPYMNYQIPSRNGGDMLNPDPFAMYDVKPGEPRPDPEPDKDHPEDNPHCK